MLEQRPVKINRGSNETETDTCISNPNVNEPHLKHMMSGLVMAQPGRHGVAPCTIVLPCVVNHSQSLEQVPGGTVTLVLGTFFLSI